MTNKAPWAMFFNMAVNNVHTVVQFLERKYALSLDDAPPPNDEAEDRHREEREEKILGSEKKKIKIPASPIIEVLRKGTDISLQANIIRDLIHYFPFLREVKNHREKPYAYEKNKETKKKPAKQLSPGEIAELFLFYAKLLYDQRNYYTHACSKPTPLDFTGKKLYDLERIIEYNRRTVNERFFKGKVPNSQAEIELLPLTPKINIQQIISQTKNQLNLVQQEICETRDQRNLREKCGQRLSTLLSLLDAQRNQNEQNELSALDDQCEQNKLSDNPVYLLGQKFFKDDNTDLSAMGRTFVIAQFLEAKYISQMIQQLVDAGELSIPECVNSDADNKLLITRAFSITHIVLPRTRLQTDNVLNPMSIGMDSLCELHKCPEALFDMISTENQGKFRFFDDKEGIENLFKRFGKDRFAYLALNYLDMSNRTREDASPDEKTTGKFERIRFHIDMGNFFFTKYEKENMIDGTKLKHRRLSKRIYCFKKLCDAQNEYMADRSKDDTLYWIPQ
ncbi:MAG: hypothetical protein FWC50_13730, partial [Planctomycetaceae bacterium]|nr:hypothetical protein [Planctomycetaceae bacterium]